MKMKLGAVALVCVLAACSNSDGISIRPEPGTAFDYRGLDGLNVIALEQTADTLLAATNEGIYKFAGEDDWTLVSPQGWNTIAITALYPSHLLASVQTGFGTFRLVESLNSGDNWTVIGTDFGGLPGEQTEPIEKLVFDDASGELFATGYDVLARSSDFGRSWSVVDGNWQGFATGMTALAFSVQNRDVWFGGQNAIESVRLRRTDRDTGNSIDLSDAVAAWLPMPSTIKSVTFLPQAGDTVFVSGEGGVLKSSDYGMSWEPILVNNTSRFYFDLAIDDGSGVIYTGGWDKNYDSPQPLRLDVSDDGGATWRSYEYADADIRGGIWSLLLARFGDDRRLFVGLQGGGVYEVNMELLTD